MDDLVKLAKTEIQKAINNNTFWDNFWFAGNWSNPWISFYEFGEYIGVKYKEDTKKHFDAYKKAANSTSIAYMYNDVVLCSERPVHIKFDHVRRLHCSDGPAILYADGYSVYAWHGLRIDKKFILNRHKLKPKEVLDETNAELRRVLFEIYADVHGPAALVKDLGAKLISEDVEGGHPRKLYQLDNQKFIHVINGSLEPDGTRREFLLGAIPDADTPHAAIAASYGRPASKYKEAVRT